MLSTHIYCTHFHYGKRFWNKNSDNEKLLGVTFDASLNFNYHNIYLKKLVQKVHVLAKITP